ncbi:MAG TPA: hypothetical protein VMM56_11215, partial [Planctomycetaceae bacterium]|nr:hypothetical protein [Planctomycetaceae bacterium]
DVVSGQLIAPTIGPTRTEQDFVEHIAQTVATDPQAKWIFIVDRLNIQAKRLLPASPPSAIRAKSKTGENGVIMKQEMQTVGLARSG